MDRRLHVLIYADDVEAYAAIARRFPAVEVQIEETVEGYLDGARDAEVVYMARKYRREMVQAARRMRWLHIGGTGIDRLHPLGDFDPGLIITHTPGLNAEMMADYTICVISMLAWDFPRLLRNQDERRWKRWAVDRLEGQTLALVGLGHIGRAIARRARCMGMRVVGVKRHPAPLAGIERVVGPEQLHAVLREADVVVLAVPLTAETQGLIGAEELAVMKPTAFLINVARGAVVQEPALVQALKASRIAGAALDVFEQEPLPPESELWRLENLIITPHISSWSRDYRARAAEVFCTNLERYLAGKPVLHVVDPSREY